MIKWNPTLGRGVEYKSRGMIHGVCQQCKKAQ